MPDGARLDPVLSVWKQGIHVALLRHKLDWIIALCK
jgi:hypothetical protein